MFKVFYEKTTGKIRYVASETDNCVDVEGCDVVKMAVAPQLMTQAYMGGMCVVDVLSLDYAYSGKATLDEVWAAVKHYRNGLLVNSDWTQLPDVPLATKAAWADYRQALRDITMQADPFNIVWPTKPE